MLSQMLRFPSFLGLWFGLWLTNKFNNFREVYQHINKNYSPYERMPSKKDVELFCFNYNLDIDNPTFIPTPYKINNIFVRRFFITRFFIVCDFSILDRPRTTQLLEDIHFMNNSVGFFTSLSSIKVEKLEEDVYYGFTIDGNHRFLLGDFTVTHNTLSMVSLVYNDKMSWNMDESYCETVETIHNCSHIKEIQHRYYHRIDTTLVLASQSIVKQWMEEFNKTPLSVQLVSTKKAVEKIQYSSGRTEQISEKVVVSSKADWEKVEILLDKSEIVGLKKIGEVKGKTSGYFSGYVSGAAADKKANKKMLEAAAEMGCPFVYMTSDSGNSGAFSYGKQALKKGIAYNYDDKE